MRLNQFAKFEPERPTPVTLTGQIVSFQFRKKQKKTRLSNPSPFKKTITHIRLRPEVTSRDRK
jgi:hypothetical protein